MSAPPRRIALAGSAGTGKTTLGRVLAAELGYVFIEEGMRKRLEAGLDWMALHSRPGGYEDLLQELWHEQQTAESEALRHAPGFVADRSPYDHGAFWLHYGSLHDRNRTDEWMGRLIAAGRTLDRVILLPWGDLPLQHDGVRSTDRWLQFRFQSILEGLLERYAPPGQVLPIPPALDLPARRAHTVHSLGVRP